MKGSNPPPPEGIKRPPPPPNPPPARSVRGDAAKLRGCYNYVYVGASEVTPHCREYGKCLCLPLHLELPANNHTAYRSCFMLGALAGIVFCIIAHSALA